MADAVVVVAGAEEVAEGIGRPRSKYFTEYLQRATLMPDVSDQQNTQCQLGSPWPWPLMWFKAAVGVDYDMQLIIGNLEDVLQKGWRMKIASNDARARLLNKATVKMGIMGNYNRGKTTMTNLLSGREVKVGNLQHTEGLSAVLSGNVAYLDTAGQNQPLCLSNQGEQWSEENAQQFRDSMSDQTNKKLLGDLFAQDMVTSLSDILVVVVNQLTLEDQRYVRSLEKKVDELEKTIGFKKQLVVIHNMKDVELTEDLHKLIEKDIVQGFGCDPKVFHGTYGQNTKYWSSPTGSTHCVMARHNSVAGRLVNSGTLALIANFAEGVFAATGKTRTKTNLLQGINEYVLSYLHLFFDKMAKEDGALHYGDVHCKDDGSSEFSLFLDPKVLKGGAVMRQNAMVADWQVIWGAKYDLDYDTVVQEKEGIVLVSIDLPGVFEEAPSLCHKTVDKRTPYVHRYTWTEGGKEKVDLVIRLAYSRHGGPGVEVTATRPGEGEVTEGVVRTHDSGKHGKAFLRVAQPEIRFDSFVDAKVVMGDNGVLNVTLAEESFGEEETSKVDTADAAGVAVLHASPGEAEKAPPIHRDIKSRRGFFG